MLVRQGCGCGNPNYVLALLLQHLQVPFDIRQEFGLRNIGNGRVVVSRIYNAGWAAAPVLNQPVGIVCSIDKVNDVFLRSSELGTLHGYISRKLNV